jgi:hypothetical protein
MNKKLSALTKKFALLGASDPESWAESQLSEGIPQLHRFLFLRQMWELVVSEDDESWIDNYVSSFRDDPDAPFAGAGRAIERMLAQGVARADIVDLVRAFQVELLSGLCYRLEDPSFSPETEDLAEGVGWALVTTNDEFEPTLEMIGGLHESVLETDPTGREMRPRPDKP